MNVTTNIPSGITYSDYQKIISQKVQFISVETLPETNIKQYPVLYKTLVNGIACLFEWTGEAWINYGGDSTPIIMTQEQYDALSEEEKNDGKIRYIETKFSELSGASGVADAELSETSTNAVQNKVVTESINDINDALTSSDELKFQFDKNDDGKYGYKDSTGNVVPFGTGSSVIMSQDDYDALSEEEKNDGAIRYIETNNETDITIDNELDASSDNAISNKVVAGAISELNSALGDLSGRQGVSNPNLLDNGWFTVNQRGATSFISEVSNRYYCDRWGARRCIGTITNDGINLAWDGVNNTTGVFFQYVNDHEKLENKTVTVSTIINDELCTFSAIFPKKGENKFKDFYFDDIRIRLAIEWVTALNCPYVYLMPFTMTPLTIKAVKLELGTESTLHLDTAPNYSEELLRCIISTADITDIYANKPINFASNFNLLDNPFFTINQREKSEYTTSGYTVDRWKIFSNSRLVYNENHTIRFIHTGTGTWTNFRQLIEKQTIDSLLGKQITLSVLLTDGIIKQETGTVPTSYPSSGLRVVDFSITDGVWLRFEINEDGQDHVTIYGDVANKEVTVKAIKLELGAQSTLHLDTVPDYSTELFKCQNSTADPSDTYANGNVIKFKIDGDGNYGYCKADGSFVPFKGKQSNENLLDNGWFTVNQRGQSEYNTNGYTVDRWKIQYGAGTVSLTDDGLTFSGTNTQLRQYINASYEKLKGKTITTSILLNNGNCEYVTKVVPNSEPSSDTLISSIRVSGFDINITYRVSGKCFTISLGIGSTESSIVIKAVKLELGTESTLYLDTTPDYGRELLRCINSHADSADTYANKYIGNPKTGNWLDNGYFLVNQRGFTSSTSISQCYTVDRWLYAYNPNGESIEVTSSGIKMISTNDGDSIIQQRFNPNYFDATKTYTFTLIVEGKEPYIVNNVRVPEQDAYDIYVINTSDVLVYTQWNGGSGNLPSIGITNKAGKNITIKAVKLELGDTSTLQDDLDNNLVEYEDELKVCQHYYYMFGKDLEQYEIATKEKGTYYSGYLTDFKIPLSVPMRTTPTLDTTNSSNYNTWSILYYNDARYRCNTNPTIQSITNDYVTMRFSHSSISSSYLKMLEAYTAGACIGLSADL